MEQEIIYRFNPDKNMRLIELRGVSFEEIITVLERKGALDVVRHHSTGRYSHPLYTTKF